MRFVVFYLDDVYEGTTLAHWDAMPNKGVLGYVFFNEDGTSGIAYGSDWYGFDGTAFYQGACSGETPGQWHEIDVAGHPKRGLWVSDEDFGVARQEMLEAVGLA